MRIVTFRRDMALTALPDRIVGTKGDDVLEAWAGIDTVIGGAGDDTVWDLDGTPAPASSGMPGDVWSPSDDMISGGGDDDLIIAGLGADTLDGGDGVDTVDYRQSASAVIVNLTTGLGFGAANSASAGDRLSSIEIVAGSAHDDWLVGTDTTQALFGHEGADTLVGGRYVRTELHGGDGDDTLIPMSFFNRSFGGDGFDTLNLSALHLGVRIGQDAHEAEAVATGGEVHGVRSVERVIGTDHADYINMAGVERSSVEVDGGAGDDILVGRAMDEATIYGKMGNDTIRGGEADDTLYGGDGRDHILGGGGRDHMSGGAGGDRLEGGAGNDQLTGGGGRDVFVFRSEVFQSVDVIRDFRRGEDAIDLRAIDARPGLAGDDLFTYNSTRATGTVFATAEFGFTFVRAHVDGDRAADLTILLWGEMALSSADFIL